MCHSHLAILFSVSLSLTLLSGCGGSDAGVAKPAADMDELAQYLAENPDQNVDGMEEMDEEGDFDDGSTR